MPQKNLAELIDTLTTLCSEDGCPWDRRQTPKSLAVYILNETYELLEGLEQDRADIVAEELGDIFFLLVFVASLYEKQGLFHLRDVFSRVNAKMVHRHPHVFAGTKIDDEQELTRQWQRLKKKEKKTQNTADEDQFDSIPKALPGLRRAQNVSERAARAGFDWPDLHGVMKKFHEEVEELTEAMEHGNSEAIEEELGDMLFVAVNIARKCHVDGERSLSRATDKFIRRYRAMEQRVRRQNLSLENLDSDTLEEYWRQVKNDLTS